MAQFCRSCKQEIVYVPTAASQGEKHMPIEAEGGVPTPNDEGNVVIDAKGQVSVVGGLLLEIARADTDQRLYMPHHAKCPFADQHRRPRT